MPTKNTPNPPKNRPKSTSCSMFSACSSRLLLRIGASRICEDIGVIRGWFGGRVVEPAFSAFVLFGLSARVLSLSAITAAHRVRSDCRSPNRYGSVAENPNRCEVLRVPPPNPGCSEAGHWRQAIPLRRPSLTLFLEDVTHQVGTHPVLSHDRHCSLQAEFALNATNARNWNSNPPRPRIRGNALTVHPQPSSSLWSRRGIGAAHDRQYVRSAGGR